MDHRDSFLQYLSIEKRYSRNTVRAYGDDLDDFLAFLNSDGIIFDPTLIDSKHIRSWIVSMMDGGMAASSVHRKISCLRSFFKYMRKQGVILKDPMEKVVLPRKKKILPVFVDESAMSRLFEGLDFGDDFPGRRNRIIIEMFYLTGMRRAELINLRDTDVDWDRKAIRVLGKRNKERMVPLLDDFMNEMVLYFKVREEQGFDKSGGWIFVTDRGNKLYEKFVYNLVKRYLSIVTTIEKKSPHVLRHTFATHMLNRGADLNSIKELLGHANLAATQIYTHNTFEKLKEIYKQAHPRAK